MKAKKGIMVGYAMQTKGYRVWIPEEEKVIETCNVSFNESVNGEAVLGLNNKSEYTPLITEESESDDRKDKYSGPVLKGESSTSEYNNHEEHHVEVVITRNFKVSLFLDKDKWFVAMKEEINFVQTRGIPNSPSQMIPDMLDWRQIWGSGRPRNGSNSAVTFLCHTCRIRPSTVLLKNGSWEPLHEWQHIWLQDVMDIPLGCHGAMDHY
ncbi:hypothetical protein TNCV_4201541 [Trichonephila clavipes]|uniref:Retroviral polymerase SH3-like domain-containing protein n=1 Tax=Trichonephila clavipes TaxID=2585209 RepID=A0A8X7BHF3_TRICX|nr:hypothetical protein TNCV_4201541 [Trichonephila clavipes]